MDSTLIRICKYLYFHYVYLCCFMYCQYGADRSNLRKIKGLRYFVYYLCELVKDYYYDKLLGIKIRSNYTTSASIFNQPMFYGMLEKARGYLHLTADDVCVDLGCGEGRAVFFMALQNIKKSIGVELYQEVIDNAKKNLRSFKKKNTPIEFINADATDFDPSEANIFLMFNPFGEKTLEAVLLNIKKSLAVRPRKIRIVYFFAVHRSLLDNQDWLERDGEIIKNGVGLVWRNKP